MNPNEKNGTERKTTFDLYLQHNAEALNEDSNRGTLVELWSTKYLYRWGWVVISHPGRFMRNKRLLYYWNSQCSFNLTFSKISVCSLFSGTSFWSNMDQLICCKLIFPPYLFKEGKWKVHAFLQYFLTSPLYRRTYTSAWHKLTYAC